MPSCFTASRWWGSSWWRSRRGLAVFAPVLSPYEPGKMDYEAILAAPSAAHPLGTDELGRDMLTRMMYGARLSLTVGIMAVLLAVAAGVPLGLVSGYVGGALDEAVMRVVDSVMALPPLVLALTISAVLGSGLVNATVAIAVVAAPTYTRLVRGQVLSVKHNDYIVAAHSIGAPTWLISCAISCPIRSARSSCRHRSASASRSSSSPA